MGKKDCLQTARMKGKNILTHRSYQSLPRRCGAILIIITHLLPLHSGHKAETSTCSSPAWLHSQLSRLTVEWIRECGTALGPRNLIFVQKEEQRQFEGRGCRYVSYQRSNHLQQALHGACAEAHSLLAPKKRRKSVQPRSGPSSQQPGSTSTHGTQG